MQTAQREIDSRMAHYWACRYAWAAERRNDIDIEDLQQAAFLGILKARKNYDATQATFGTWAGYYARNEIRELLGIRHGQLPPQLESLDEPLSEDSEETRLDLLQDETIPEADAGLLDAERRQTIRDAVNRLADDQRDVVILRYFKDQSFTQAAEAMNITPVRAAKIFDNARRHLRHDYRLKALIDFETPFMLHVGVAQYNSTMTSATEKIAIMREYLENKLLRNQDKEKDN